MLIKLAMCHVISELSCLFCRHLFCKVMLGILSLCPRLLNVSFHSTVFVIITASKPVIAMRKADHDRM